MNDENLESKALCKGQQFHECSFCSNRRHAAGKLLVVYTWLNCNKYLLNAISYSHVIFKLVWLCSMNFHNHLMFTYIHDEVSWNLSLCYSLNEMFLSVRLLLLTEYRVLFQGVVSIWTFVCFLSILLIQHKDLFH